MGCLAHDIVSSQYGRTLLEVPDGWRADAEATAAAQSSLSALRGD